ncbi:MAG TPA: lipopolysaccharide assembly protein LapA domain-containing protein [Chloroflexota bacterium]|nr:lipopolysaccharide assembly protein LapA domain-containing protein [Chloroflexota bacterium]
MQIFWTAALIFGIVIALFAVQNSSPTTIRFLWLSAENVAVSVLVMICAALGALVTLMFGLGREVRLGWGRRRSRRTIAHHEQRIAELEKSVEQLTAEKAALQTDLDVATGRAPHYEAIPYEPPAVGTGGERRPLGTGDEPPAVQDASPKL